MIPCTTVGVIASCNGIGGDSRGILILQDVVLYTLIHCFLRARPRVILERLKGHEALKVILMAESAARFDAIVNTIVTTRPVLFGGTARRMLLLIESARIVLNRRLWHLGRHTVRELSLNLWQLLTLEWTNCLEINVLVHALSFYLILRKTIRWASMPIFVELLLHFVIRI